MYYVCPAGTVRYALALQVMPSSVTTSSILGSLLGPPSVVPSEIHGSETVIGWSKTVGTRHPG